MTVRSPEERTAEAQKLRDKGDGRPVSQIEAELLAQEQQDAANSQNPDLSERHAAHDRADRG